MIRRIAFPLLLGLLSGCQGTIAGQHYMVTIPPHCKANGNVAFGGLSPPAGSYSFECDRTGATTPTPLIAPATP